MHSSRKASRGRFVYMHAFNDRIVKSLMSETLPNASKLIFSRRQRPIGMARETKISGRRTWLANGYS